MPTSTKKPDQADTYVRREPTGKQADAVPANQASKDRKEQAKLPRFNEDNKDKAYVILTIASDQAHDDLVDIGCGRAGPKEQDQAVSLKRFELATEPGAFDDGGNRDGATSSSRLCKA